MMNRCDFPARLVLSALIVCACGGGRNREGGPEPRGGLVTNTAVQGTQVDEPLVAPADSADERLAGQVLITGTERMEFVTLQMEAGGAVNLSGPLLSELRRLTGAMVAVRGARKAGTPFEEFEVTAYDVTSIDGRRPSVGILEERDGALILVGVQSVRLTGVSDALRLQVGTKIWVVGRQTDNGLQVQSYGVIREPGVR